MILQRYTFGSKSQHSLLSAKRTYSCLWYCKDIHLEANHNNNIVFTRRYCVAYDIAKIYIWKQITTRSLQRCTWHKLLMILQRYTFGSKSQQIVARITNGLCCLWYCKDIHLEANHNHLMTLFVYLAVAYDIAKIGNFSQMATP